MQTNFLIATRVYPINDLITGIEYEARDYMYREPDGSFVLKETTSGLPGMPDSEQAYSLEGVFAWLRELPEQIERNVFN